MIIYPAIDIKGGKCVRLKQGKFEDATIYFDNPVDAAVLWAKSGAQAIHVVDLDGAGSGLPKNTNSILQIKNITDKFVQVGGGIRNRQSVEYLIENGIDRVIFGTAAINNKSLVEWAVNKYGNKIAVSIDAIGSKAAYNGWTGVSELTVESLLEELISFGVDTFVYTDINRDGMLGGPDTRGLKNINEKYNLKIIASGGVSTIEDLKQLKKLNLYGAIVGKALYNGNINLKSALEVV